MVQILWVFEVRPGCEAEFERAYRSDGDWAQLFRKGEGYLGTTMLRDAENPSRWLIVDRWDSQASFEAFQRAHRESYEELDRRCEEFTRQETRIGIFEEGAAADQHRKEAN